MDDSLARFLFIGIGFLSAVTYATLAVVAYRQRSRHLALGWWTVYCVVAGAFIEDLMHMLEHKPSAVLW